MEKKIIWKPHQGPQTEALQRTEFEILYGGARGGGKTDAGMAWLLRHIDNPLYRALIIRKNADDLCDWVDRARQMYIGTGATFAYRPAVIVFPSGAIFRTGHLKDENAYGKYQGHEYQKMVLEELTQIPTEELYLKLISSCRSTIDIKPQIFATTNPGGIGHAWVKKRYVDVAEHGKVYRDKITKRTRIFIPAKVTDNPTLIDNDPNYVSFLDGLPEQLRKAWREGNWDIVAGQVFTEWNQEIHVVKPFKIPPEWNKWISIDWGVNKQSAVGWYTQNYDGRIYLYRELYVNGNEFHKMFGKPLTPKRMAIVIKSMTGKEKYQYCTADPSMWNKTLSGKGGKAIDQEGESIAETMMKNGIKMIKGDNDRYNGLGRYREMLSIAPDGIPWFQVFSTCLSTINTLPSLIYDTTASRIEEVDTTGEDHCYDRDRYFFMSRPAIPKRPAKPISGVRQKYYQLLKQQEDEETEYI